MNLKRIRPHEMIYKVSVRGGQKILKTLSAPNKFYREQLQNCNSVTSTDWQSFKYFALDLAQAPRPG